MKGRDPLEARAPPQEKAAPTVKVLRAFRRRRNSVRARLVGMVLLTTSIVLLLSDVALLVNDLSNYRASWASDISTEASILAASVAPAMAFDDRRVALQNLTALEARESVLAAALYLPDNNVFAVYRRANEPAPPAILDAKEGIQINGEDIEIVRRIIYNQEALGAIYLHAHYDVMGRVTAYLQIFSAIAAFSLLLVLVLSARLQERIIQPLEAISEVARQIINRRDYSLRVTPTTEDEIGVVVLALNNMLEEVQLRTQALEESNTSLQQEVTERQAAQAALGLANARLQSTMAAAEVGGWVSDLKTGELKADRNFAALFGLPPDEPITRDQIRSLFVHAGDATVLDQADEHARETGTLASGEFRIRPLGGGERWVMARGKLQLDAEGHHAFLAGMLIDVTRQKQAEQERRNTERVYRAIGESIDFGVWLTDAAGNNTYISDSFLQLTGLAQDQCAGLGWISVLHPDDVASTTASWAETVQTGHDWYREYRVHGSDGRYHPVLARGVPVRREDGSIYAWAGINLDISRLKLTEEALRTADRRKDEFLATLAHELRNPLAPIDHACRVLSAAAVTEQQRDWARAVIVRQVRNMALLLDDLLDVSRITRGRLELKPGTVSLEQLVGSAVETARPLIDSKSHTLNVLMPEQSLMLHVDALRMAQVLSNLLTNAAKYTDAGGRIELRAAVDASGLAIRVSDSGIGLSDSSLRRVFDMFSQVETSLGRSQGGLGIGLALARGLTELHGGTVEASSAGPGLGSTFTVRLPPAVLAAVSPATDVPQTASPESGMHEGMILVADDNRDAADSLAGLLRLLGYKVLTAYSGREALDIALATTPQTAILDIGMPEINGYEVARRIREQPWSRGTALIALSGWGKQEDLNRARAAGFDHHFRKPVDVDELLDKLRSLRALTAAATH